MNFLPDLRKHDHCGNDDKIKNERVHNKTVDNKDNFDSVNNND